MIVIARKIFATFSALTIVASLCACQPDQGSGNDIGKSIEKAGRAARTGVALVFEVGG